MAVIRSAIVKLGMDIKDFVTGANQAEASAKKMHRGIGGSMHGLNSLAKSFNSLFVGAAVVHVASKVLEFADNVKAAKKEFEDFSGVLSNADANSLGFFRSLPVIGEMFKNLDADARAAEASFKQFLAVGRKIEDLKGLFANESPLDKEHKAFNRGVSDLLDSSGASGAQRKEIIEVFNSGWDEYMRLEDLAEQARSRFDSLNEQAKETEKQKAEQIERQNELAHELADAIRQQVVEENRITEIYNERRKHQAALIDMQDKEAAGILSEIETKAERAEKKMEAIERQFNRRGITAEEAERALQMVRDGLIGKEAATPWSSRELAPGYGFGSRGAALAEIANSRADELNKDQLEEQKKHTSILERLANLILGLHTAETIF